MNTTDGVWLTISDYSAYKKVSISTIRRHIKANVLKFKEENGKYFIYVHNTEKIKTSELDEVVKLRFEIELLKTQLRFLKEENDELRMLINIYEENAGLFPKRDDPPELPGQI